MMRAPGFRYVLLVGCFGLLSFFFASTDAFSAEQFSYFHFPDTIDSIIASGRSYTLMDTSAVGVCPAGFGTRDSRLAVGASCTIENLDQTTGSISMARGRYVSTVWACGTEEWDDATKSMRSVRSGSIASRERCIAEESWSECLPGRIAVESDTPTALRLNNKSYRCVVPGPTTPQKVSLTVPNAASGKAFVSKLQIVGGSLEKFLAARPVFFLGSDDKKTKGATIDEPKASLTYLPKKEDFRSDNTNGWLAEIPSLVVLPDATPQSVTYRGTVTTGDGKLLAQAYPITIVQEAKITVAKVSGAPQYTPAGSEELLPLAVGTVLGEGDIVQNGDGITELSIGKTGTLTMLWAHTSLLIDEVALENDLEKVQFSLTEQMVNQAVSVKVRHVPAVRADFAVRHGEHVSSVRGSAMLVKYHTDDQVYSVFALEGNSYVSVKGKEEAVISQGRKMDIPWKAKVLPSVRAFSATDLAAVSPDLVPPLTVTLLTSAAKQDIAAGTTGVEMARYHVQAGEKVTLARLGKLAVSFTGDAEGLHRCQLFNGAKQVETKAIPPRQGSWNIDFTRPLELGPKESSEISLRCDIAADALGKTYAWGVAEQSADAGEHESEKFAPLVSIVRRPDGKPGVNGITFTVVEPDITLDAAKIGPLTVTTELVQIAPGATLQGMVRVENTGGTTWQPGDYRLVPSNASDAPRWFLREESAVTLDETVVANTAATIPLELVAPAPGTYRLKFHLERKGGHRGFVQQSVAAVLTVVGNKAEQPIATTAPADQPSFFDRIANQLGFSDPPTGGSGSTADTTSTAGPSPSASDGGSNRAPKVKSGEREEGDTPTQDSNVIIEYCEEDEDADEYCDI